MLKLLSEEYLLLSKFSVYDSKSEGTFSIHVPCFPENKTGLILIFTPKYGTRAYFRGMYYFDQSKNEVTK